MIERRLQQVDLRLQKVALRLRHEERRRQSDIVAPLLVGVALLGQRCAGAGRFDTLGGALHLTSGLAHRLGGVEPKTGDALRRLSALDLRARVARLFVALPERIAHRHTEAPRRVVRAERLAERVAEAPIARAGDDAREDAGAKELVPPRPLPRYDVSSRTSGSL